MWQTAALQDFEPAYDRNGSWLRENVLAGADTSEHQLTNSGTGKTCHVLAITSWNRLYRLPGRCERSGGGVENMGAPMPSPHARIAAMSGCTPTMIMTRVRLEASTCSAISVATFGSRLLRRGVAPIRILSLP